MLRDVSFTLIPGHTKIILGASGAGKSTILKLILGLLKPDSGVVWVNGERVDQMSEDELMPVRDDIGMVFQEGALFDSLTVRENVGYKLYEETDRAARGGADARVEEVLGFVGLANSSTGCRRSCPAGSGAAWRSRARWRPSRACCSTTSRRPASIPITAATVDDEIIKLRDLENVSSIVVTHQLRDAFYIATHQRASGNDGEIRVGAGRRDEGRGSRVHDAARRPDRLRGHGRRAARRRRTPTSGRSCPSADEDMPCHAPVHSPSRS